MKKTIEQLTVLKNQILDLLFPNPDIRNEDILGKINISKKYDPFGHINLFNYKDELIRKCIWLIKFKNNRKLAQNFSIIINDVITEELYNLEKLENFSDPILVKVPSSKSSLKTRGYDQNDLFLKDLIKSKTVEYGKNIIVKKIDSKRQSNFKDKEARIRNISNNFLIKNKKIIEQRNIILFDDIKTSGATINECKKILKKCKVKKILVLTLAS